MIEENFGLNEEFSFGELEKKSEFKDRTLRRYLKTLEGIDLVGHNGKTGKDSRYTLLSSVSSVSEFRSKVLGILEEIEEKPKSHEITPMSSKDGNETGIEDIEDNIGQEGLSSIEPNNDNELHQENAFEDIRTEDHSEYCDCWECCPKPDYCSGIEEVELWEGTVISKLDNEHYQVIVDGENGEATVSIVTRQSPEFEAIKRDYEHIMESRGMGIGGIDSDTEKSNLLKGDTDTGIGVSKDTEGVAAEHPTTQANACLLPSTNIKPEQSVEPLIFERPPFELNASDEISEAPRGPKEEETEVMERWDYVRHLKEDLEKAIETLTSRNDEIMSSPEADRRFDYEAEKGERESGFDRYSGKPLKRGQKGRLTRLLKKHRGKESVILEELEDVCRQLEILEELRSKLQEEIDKHLKEVRDYIDNC